MSVPARLGWVGVEGLARALAGRPGRGVGPRRQRRGRDRVERFQRARNFAGWQRHFGEAVLPWTWFGPPASSDGRASAEAFHTAAPGAVAYMADIESTLSGAAVWAFCDHLCQLEPDALLGFSSYPTRKQSMNHGVPWDACVDGFDIGLPQVYFPEQRRKLDQVIDDHRGKPVHVAVSTRRRPGVDRDRQAQPRRPRRGEPVGRGSTTSPRGLPGPAHPGNRTRTR
jgi:hypothetical protein